MDKFTPITSELYAYVLAHRSERDPVLAALAAETAKLGGVSLMQVAPEQGAFLTLLTRAIGARSAVEVGTFTGYSALCIARGLPDDGRLLCCDINEEWTAIGRRHWEKAGVASRIDLRIAPALDTLRALPASTQFDLAFIDADKTGYRAYYEEILARLRPNGLVLFDNVLWMGQRAADRYHRREHTRAARVERFSRQRRPRRGGDARGRRRAQHRPQARARRARLTTAFRLERAVVRDGVELAFVREGAGGYPLLLVHGWPETKRIWWRNIAPLAAAGFEVIVPDLRGFGDSGLPADGFYDLAAHARDLYALVHDVLGHARCGAAGGDLGGGVIQDLGLRFPGVIERQCSSTPSCRCCRRRTRRPAFPPSRKRESAWPPTISSARAAKPTRSPPSSTRPSKRRRYIAQFYGPRFWATPGRSRPRTSTS